MTHYTRKNDPPIFICSEEIQFSTFRVRNKLARRTHCEFICCIVNGLKYDLTVRSKSFSLAHNYHKRNIACEWTVLEFRCSHLMKFNVSTRCIWWHFKSFDRLDSLEIDIQVPKINAFVVCFNLSAISNSDRNRCYFTDARIARMQELNDFIVFSNKAKFLLLESGQFQIFRE